LNMRTMNTFLNSFFAGQRDGGGGIACGKKKSVLESKTFHGDGIKREEGRTVSSSNCNENAGKEEANTGEGT